MVKGAACFKGPRCFNGPGFVPSTGRLTFHCIVIAVLCNFISISSNPIQTETQSQQNSIETSDHINEIVQHLNAAVSDEFNQTLIDHDESTPNAISVHSDLKDDHVPDKDIVTDDSNNLLDTIVDQSDHSITETQITDITNEAPHENTDEVQNKANENLKTTLEPNRENYEKNDNVKPCGENRESVKDINDTIHNDEKTIQDASIVHNVKETVEHEYKAEKVNERISETHNPTENSDTLEISNDELENDDLRKIEKRETVDIQTDLKNAGNLEEDNQKGKSSIEDVNNIPPTRSSANNHESIKHNKGNKHAMGNGKGNVRATSTAMEPITVLENTKLVHNEPITIGFTKPGDKLVRQKSILDSLLETFQSYKTEDVEKIIPLVKTDIYDSKERLPWAGKGTDGGDKTSSISKNGDQAYKDSNVFMARTKEVEDHDHRDTKEHGHKERNKEERKIKLQKSLSSVEDVHKMLTKQIKNDIYNPPGLNIDQEKHKRVKRKLKKIKSDKLAFELSANHRYDEMSHNLNSNASTVFKNIEPDSLMSGGKKSNTDVKWHAKGRKDSTRSMVANMKIQPLTGVGHSESFLSPPGAGPGPPSRTPFVWSRVPDHFSYLGLIDVPEKYRTNDYDRSLMSDYATIMKDVKQDLYEGAEKGRLLRHGDDMLGEEPKGGTHDRV
uniref:Uncharacterized protein n=1 Tax=Cacopsylla melanoneura TaxID=428564 RepID=A0A8D8SS75_9HEMI